MAGAIRHEGDESFELVGVRTGSAGDLPADPGDHLEVRSLRIAPEIVGLPVDALLDHGPQRFDVVLDEEPVPRVTAISVHGERFAP